MDGVLVHEEHAIPGADRFIERLARRADPVPRADQQLDLHAARPRRPAARAAGSTSRRSRSGPRRWRPRRSSTTSARAARAYVIGEAGLTTALHEVGLHPDRARPGLRRARRDPHLQLRAHHHGHPTDRRRRPVHRHQPGPDGPERRTGRCPRPASVAALISRATGVEPYFVGKPNPLMMRIGAEPLDAHSEKTAMVGDRMDTDVVAGLEAGLETSWCSAASPRATTPSGSRSCRPGSSTRWLTGRRARTEGGS